MKGRFYERDLAYVHDDGFGGPARSWAPVVLSLLKSQRTGNNLVVDLGCGSGILAEKLSRAGYEVEGIDSSAAFLMLARKRAPKARFRNESLFRVSIPSCAMVVSTGECLNYLFDPRSNQSGLLSLFRRIYAALDPGGLFIFDLADQGQVPPGQVIRNFTEGKGWIVLVEKIENPHNYVLTRRIITFRKIGTTWRRSEETHRQRLYKTAEILRILRAAGFQARTFPHRKAPWLSPAHTAFFARKIN